MVKHVNKTRVGIPGHPKLSGVVNQHSWGDHAAVRRGYCSGTEHPMGTGAAKSIGPQHPQGDVDQHDAKYDNDVRDGWMRGGGPNGAEGRPGYVAGYRSPSHAGVGRNGGTTGDEAVGHYDPKPMRQGPGAIRGRR